MTITYADYQTLLLVWMGIAVIVFLVLLHIKAPYGRHTTRNWGPMIDNHIGWIIMESPGLIVMAYILSVIFPGKAAVTSIMVALYCFHYFNRSIIFPLRIHTKGKKMPLVISLMAITFNLVNTFFLGYYFLYFAVYSNEWLLSWQFICGSLLFISGMFINWKADNMLIHLRRKHETHYSIPGGWLFEWISCPNLFGELVEWGGFALLCWNMPALSFFIWSVANLLPRAMAHHRWYKEKFPEYPDSRKAVVPFVI